MIDAILGAQPISAEELPALDRNADGRLDVADLVAHRNLYGTGAYFLSEASSMSEATSGHSIALEFHPPVTAQIGFTIGGSTDASEFAISPIDGVLQVDGSTAEIQLSGIADHVFEGEETIVLSLLPGLGYELGERRTHTVTMTDNPAETGADYLFVLSANDGAAGSSSDLVQGLAPSLRARTARLHLVFSEDEILRASLLETGSLGVSDSEGAGDVIAADAVSYADGTLELRFSYSTSATGLTSEPNLTDSSFNANFDPEFDEFPEVSTDHAITLAHVLTITVNDFDIATEKFSDEPLVGTFSLQTTGLLGDGSEPIMSGDLIGALQL